MINEKVLVSSRGLSQLFIYNRNDRNLSIISIKYNDTLLDATWTSNGNLVYTTYSSKLVTILWSFGQDITKQTYMEKPMYLSVSYDDIIFVVDFHEDFSTGVYQSTDDGISWSRVFNSPGGLYFYQVIKVKTDYNGDFWILEMNARKNYCLRMYSVDENSPNGNVTWKDIKVPMTDGKYINLSKSMMSYDGNMSIFLSDPDNKAVHVLSVNNQCHYQLSPHHIMHVPRRLSVDKKSLELLVGQDKGVVGVFKLTYELGLGHVCN